MRKVIAASSAIAFSLFAFASQAQEAVGTQAGATATASADKPADSAPAADEGPRGFELGARIGYALPMGSAQEDAKMSDAISGQLPLVLDAGYRITPNIYVGAYGQIGYVMQSDKACPDGVSCSATDIKLGANVHYHFLPAATFDPWVGVGAGYEWLHSSASKGEMDVSSTGHGFELLNLQVGGDYRLAKQVAIGPFVGFSLGQYSKASITTNGKEASGDIEKTAMHEWLTLGVKGTFNL
jgi:outer membrane protein W